MGTHIITGPTTGGGTGGGTVEDGTSAVGAIRVAIKADLPVASTVSGMFYRVEMVTGFWPLKSEAGVYESDGLVWVYRGSHDDAEIQANIDAVQVDGVLAIRASGAELTVYQLIRANLDSTLGGEYKFRTVKSSNGVESAEAGLNYFDTATDTFLTANYPLIEVFVADHLTAQGDVFDSVTFTAVDNGDNTHTATLTVKSADNSFILTSSLRAKYNEAFGVFEGGLVVTGTETPVTNYTKTTLDGVVVWELVDAVGGKTVVAAPNLPGFSLVELVEESEFYIRQDLSSPSAVTHLSTQGVQDAIAAIPVGNPLLRTNVATANLVNNSNVTLMNIPELQFTVEAGKSYAIQGIIKASTATSSSGVHLSIFSTGVADGDLSALIVMPVNSSAAQLKTITLGQLAQASSGYSGEVKMALTIDGLFTCTTSGSLSVSFKSEANLNNITIYASSFLRIEEL